MDCEIVKFNEIPLTMSQVADWGSDIFYTKKAIEYHCKKTTEHSLILGCLLSRVEQNKSWQSDGTMAHSFFEWVTKEIGIKRTSAQRLISVWEAFGAYIVCEKELILGIDFSKLALIAPYVSKLENPDDAIDMIHSLENNSYRACEDNLRELKGEITRDSCLHDADIKTIVVCKKCGKVLSIEST